MAAIQDGTFEEHLLIQVQPRAVGIEVAGGEFYHLIKAGTPVPINGGETFQTSRDDQTEVSVRLFEGNTTSIEDACHVGDYDFEGIPAMPQGQAQIEVKLSVSSDGALSVAATELTSGNELQLKSV